MKVSIVTITYNHSKYITQAIESFLMQKTNFDFEVIIADDASTDNNQEIIQEYQKKYPEIIKPILRKENIGMNHNFVDAVNQCKGKYIALCEGDDYWTDPLKLQKQVDFLEANHDFSLCFHNSLVLWEDKSKPPKLFCANNQKATSTIEDVIKSWFIPTQSMLFRVDIVRPLPQWFMDIYNGDYALQFLLAHKGKIGYINRMMSVYRRNLGSLSVGIGKNTVFVTNQVIKLLNTFNDTTEREYNRIIQERISFLFKKKNKYNLIKKKLQRYFINKLAKKSFYIYRR